jgi:very-short-patch-repair endonuclease
MAGGVVGIQRVSEEKVEDSRKLRKKMTPAEAVLWENLRGRRCGGFKFRRQQVVEGFIADFYCEVSQLVVEVDGGIHADPEVKSNDEHREKVFKARGIGTIRFSNEQVFESVDNVLNEIEQACITNKKSSSLTAWESGRKPFPHASEEAASVFYHPFSLQERGQRGEV